MYEIKMESVHNELIRILFVPLASTKQLSELDVFLWSVSCWEGYLKQRPLRARCKNNLSSIWYYWGLKIVLSLKKMKQKYAKICVLRLFQHVSKSNELVFYKSVAAILKKKDRIDLWSGRSYSGYPEFCEVNVTFLHLAFMAVWKVLMGMKF